MTKVYVLWAEGHSCRFQTNEIVHAQNFNFAHTFLPNGGFLNSKWIKILDEKDFQQFFDIPKYRASCHDATNQIWQNLLWDFWLDYDSLSNTVNFAIYFVVDWTSHHSTLAIMIAAFFAQWLKMNVFIKNFLTGNVRFLPVLRHVQSEVTELNWNELNGLVLDKPTNGQVHLSLVDVYVSV